ncbi:hypothetical protein FRUB_04036 [Fimbriiglobus ruber]|uniref:Uncharacterized protein n=2 Tax=Fimbriiglobus ruber TaxID=1908690 RepID=A0A225DTU0_9BACT|nr:hypothetical protein FRUB_04036 [Fimbriiglobus ruber]
MPPPGGVGTPLPGPAVPPGSPPTPVYSGLFGGASPPPIGTGSIDTLTGPPSYAAQPLPTGVATNPLVGGGYNIPSWCCGPVGGNGPITYELYTRTGPNFTLGGGSALSGALKNGWVVQGGGRSLFFNQARDAAWALDLGIGYTYTPGDRNSILTTDPSIKFINANPTGSFNINTPVPVYVGGIYRTTFNYAVGRDWFLSGPGTTNQEEGWNSRLGLDVGGRWGTVHADLYNVGNTGDPYIRRQAVSQSVFLGANYNWERSFGGWIWFGGFRTEWGATVSNNLIAPQSTRLFDVNLLMMAGVRY